MASGFCSNAPLLAFVQISLSRINRTIQSQLYKIEFNNRNTYFEFIVLHRQSLIQKINREQAVREDDLFKDRTMYSLCDILSGMARNYRC